MSIQFIFVKLPNSRSFQMIEIRKMTKKPKLAEFYKITELPRFSKTVVVIIFLYH